MDFPVDLTLSFESCMRIERSLEVVIAQIAIRLDECKPKVKEDVPSRVYLNTLMYTKLKEEAQVLTDLQRLITMRLDNIADNYQSTANTEVACECNGYSASFEDGNSSKADIITTNL